MYIDIRPLIYTETRITTSRIIIKKNVMYNKYIYLCFMLFVSVIGRSQTSTDTVSVVTPEMQRLELVKQLWLPTRNASGLGFDPVADHGDAWFGVFHSSGDYHRAQEGSRVNGLSFLGRTLF